MLSPFSIGWSSLKTSLWCFSTCVMKCERSVWLGFVFPVDTKGRSPIARHTPCTGHWRRRKTSYSLLLQNEKLIYNNQITQALSRGTVSLPEAQSSPSVWRLGIASQVWWIHLQALRSSCCSASPRPAAAQDPTSLSSLILALTLVWRAAAPVPCSKFSNPGTSLFNFPASRHMARLLPWVL